MHGRYNNNNIHYNILGTARGMSNNIIMLVSCVELCLEISCMAHAGLDLVGRLLICGHLAGMAWYNFLKKSETTSCCMRMLCVSAVQTV